MFLSVPLLFAMHAWLDTIAKRENYGQEAREDARFIMGMLEGRWLASAEDAGEDAGGGGEPDRPVAVGHSASAANEAHPPISDWKVLGRLQELQGVYHQTGEVIVIGLLLRWIVVASGYTLFFFGFMIFHWDLHALIHPSGGQIFGANHTAHESNVSSHEAPVLHVEAPKAPLVQLVSTTMAATAAQVMTMAPGFPFRGSPKLEGADLPEVPESGNILKIHTTGMPEEATQAASSTRAGLPDGGEWAGAVPFAVPSAEGVAAFGAPNGDRGARLKLRPGPSVAPEAKGEEVPRTGGATSSTQSSTSSREVDQMASDEEMPPERFFSAKSSWALDQLAEQKRRRCLWLILGHQVAALLLSSLTLQARPELLKANAFAVERHLNWGSGLVALSDLLLSPILGALSDRVGRRPLMISLPAITLPLKLLAAKFPTPRILQLDRVLGDSLRTLCGTTMTMSSLADLYQGPQLVNLLIWAAPCRTFFL
eukprot:g30462.t2